jgi:hypothetical protein
MMETIKKIVLAKVKKIIINRIMMMLNIDERQRVSFVNSYI